MAKKVTGTILKFADMLEQAQAEQYRAEALRKQREDEARAAKKEEEMKGREVSRLHRIAYLAGNTRNTMVWTQTQDTRAAGKNTTRWNPVAWRQSWELNTSMLDFEIHLKERTDMKRDKWEVSVNARHRTLSESGRARDIHGGYTNHTYAKEKYMKYISYGNYEEIPGQELTKKFKSEKDARAFVDMWMERLYSDHAGEIELDRALREQCLATGYKFEQY